MGSILSIRPFPLSPFTILNSPFSPGVPHCSPTRTLSDPTPAIAYAALTPTPSNPALDDDGPQSNFHSSPFTIHNSEDLPDPDSLFLPSPETIAAFSTLDEVGDAALLIKHFERRLIAWAVVDAARPHPARPRRTRPGVPGPLARHRRAQNPPRPARPPPWNASAPPKKKPRLKPRRPKRMKNFGRTSMIPRVGAMTSRCWRFTKTPAMTLAIPTAAMTPATSAVVSAMDATINWCMKKARASASSPPLGARTSRPPPLPPPNPPPLHHLQFRNPQSTIRNPPPRPLRSFPLISNPISRPLRPFLPFPPI